MEKQKINIFLPFRRSSMKLKGDVVKVPLGSYIRIGEIYDVTKAAKEVHFRNVVTNGATYIKDYMIKFGEFEIA